MRLLGRVFKKLLADEFDKTTRLGCPSKDGAEAERRAQAMYNMTGGKGFRVWPRGPKLSKGGKTRRELEAPARAIYARNVAAETAFREAHANQPGWGIATINRAIERRLHLKVLT